MVGVPQAKQSIWLIRTGSHSENASLRQKWLVANWVLVGLMKKRALRNEFIKSFILFVTCLKQHHIEILNGTFWDLAPPTVHECNTAVVNTKPRFLQQYCHMLYI